MPVDPARTVSSDRPDRDGGDGTDAAEVAPLDALGLSSGAVILAAAAAPAAVPPMSQPDDTWALLVTAVDLTIGLDPEAPPEVWLFAGTWMPDRPPAEEHDRDVVIRLTDTETKPGGAAPSGSGVTVEVLASRHDAWHHIGRWPQLGTDWPRVVAPAVAALSELLEDA